jgi:hypothetical protein
MGDREEVIGELGIGNWGRAISPWNPLMDVGDDEIREKFWAWKLT